MGNLRIRDSDAQLRRSLAQEATWGPCSHKILVMPCAVKHPQHTQRIASNLEEDDVPLTDGLAHQPGTDFVELDSKVRVVGEHFKTSADLADEAIRSSSVVAGNVLPDLRKV